MSACRTQFLALPPARRNYESRGEIVRKHLGNIVADDLKPGGFDNRSWLNPCMDEAGIENALWHTHRHTFCSWLAMAGASMKEIQEAAGHKTIAMSARYARLAPEHTQSVVERIARTGTKQAPESSGNSRRDQQAPKQAPAMKSRKSKRGGNDT